MRIYTEAPTVTNSSLDLVPQVPPPGFGPIRQVIPDEATNADASTEAVKPFQSTPVPGLSQSIAEASSKAANADASIEATQHPPFTPTADSSQAIDEAFGEAANADASTKATQHHPYTPTADLSQTIDEAFGEAANADASREATQSPSYTPTADLSRNNKHTSRKATYAEIARDGPSTPSANSWQRTDSPNKATNGEAVRNDPSERPNIKRYNNFAPNRQFISKSTISKAKAKAGGCYSNAPTVSVAQQPHHESTDATQPPPRELSKRGVWPEIPEELFVEFIVSLNHSDRVALSQTSSAMFNSVNLHVATWHPQKFKQPVIATFDTELRKFSRPKMDSPSHVLFVDILMPTTDKYYLESKDGRTTTHNRDIVAKYEHNYRNELLRLFGSLIRTHKSIRNLSFMQNDELTPNALNRILEAMPTVEYVSLIHCNQFNYETMYCLDVSESAPELYLECSIPHNFNSGPLYNASWTALLWVYLQRYRSRMTGETLERDEDTDEEHEAQGISTTSVAPPRPWDELNHIIGIGSSGESLLANQMRTNPNFLRHFSWMLLRSREGGPRMIENMITGKTEPWQLATILYSGINFGKRLDPKSLFGRYHHCCGCSQRLQGLSFALSQLKKRDEDATCMACHAEEFGEPPYRASDWKLKDPLHWELSKPFEIHFNEVCPVNLLGDKCKCKLTKVDVKVISPYRLLKGVTRLTVNRTHPFTTRSHGCNQPVSHFSRTGAQGRVATKRITISLNVVGWLVKFGYRIIICWIATLQAVKIGMPD